MFICDFCSYQCQNRDNYFRHLSRFHSNEPHFVVYCGKEGCGQSFRKIDSLRKHFYRRHKETADAAEEIGNHEDNQDDNNDDDCFNEEEAVQNLQRSAAKFLLQVKTEGKISGAAIKTVQSSTKALLNECMDALKKKLLAQLQEGNGEFQFTQQMKESFKVDGFFSGLETDYQQNNYYKENFNLVVSTLYLRTQDLKIR